MPLRSHQFLNLHRQETTDETLISVSTPGGGTITAPLVASPAPADNEADFKSFPGFENHRAATEPMSDEEKPRAVRREATIDYRDMPEVIPPEHSHRTLIVCFDGTGDQFDADNSNIVQLVSLLKKDDKNKQLVYYQTGIGTYTSPKVASPLMSKVMKTLDLMFALNLNAHVMSGYEFLMNNYVSGDKICIFGFSRGAYTARSLAGMLHKVGLLPAGNYQQVPFAYKMYTRTDSVGWEESTEFKKAFSVDVSIEFIGVWDTVDSVGIIPKRLPFTTSNTIVKTFRHAVSLDERRAKFKANLWNRPTEEEQKLGKTSPAPPPPSKPSHGKEQANGNATHVKTKPVQGYDSYEDALNRLRHGSDEKDGEKDEKNLAAGIDLINNNLKKMIHNDKENEDDKLMNKFERIYSEQGEKQTDVEEVWFAGCHCDVGGGSVSNKTRHSLARIALRWMVRECFKANTGIMFNSSALYDIGLDPTTLYPFVAPRPPPLPLNPSTKIQIPPAVEIPIRRPRRLLSKKKSLDLEAKIRLELERREPFLGSEEEEELKDSMAPKYDQLKISKWWWFLEILPLHLRYQRSDSKWVTYYGPNMGRPRFIPNQKAGLKVHRSVKLRMDAEFEDEERRKKGKKYKPKPVFLVDPIYVD
ncbi:hypothetical protein CPC08DRAFT_759803 [Agrocybe pediades]|nr:hypothetical protein CPC08DRAFT_759803 [Agrocybe pediades]